MVYQHSIPFGAPSQLRLLISTATEGDAELSILDQFNQPMGNLQHMRVPLGELKAVVDGSHVEAKADKAVCQLKIAEDARKEDIEIHYEDLDRNRKVTATVTKEDFEELLKTLLQE